MSADNGIYILETTNNGEKEYRVAHCQAVDNIAGNDIISDAYTYYTHIAVHKFF